MQRLGRVLAAIDSEKTRAEPKTVEKVVLNRGREELVDGAPQQATPVGTEFTRKSLARSLQQV